MADFIRFQAQRARQQPHFEQAPATDSDATLQPGLQHADRRQRHQHERPGRQPAAIEPALERGLADHPPGADPKQVFGQMRHGQPNQPPRQFHLAKLAPEGGSRRQAETPTIHHLAIGEAVREDGAARAFSPARGNLGLLHDAIDLPGQPGFEFLAQPFLQPL